MNKSEYSVSRYGCLCYQSPFRSRLNVTGVACNDETLKKIRMIEQAAVFDKGIPFEFEKSFNFIH